MLVVIWPLKKVMYINLDHLNMILWSMFIILICNNKKKYSHDMLYT